MTHPSVPALGRRGRDFRGIASVREHGGRVIRHVDDRPERTPGPGETRPDGVLPNIGPA